ncbi:alpha/beta fold hydrolase [Microbacterium sp. RD1]|uniref:alpha/beta fold hydrolase n=1 Tax=Microbacterium sp. RD1 TaxID=3457313 RepID=UPI003FA57D89
MTPRVQPTADASLAYEVHGEGAPLLAFHGAYSSRTEVRGFLEPMLDGRRIRRIYVDLPGHGESRPSGGVRTPDDMLDLLDELLAAEASGERFLLLGHSYGGHVARAVAARHGERVAGIALLCPMLPGEQEAAPAVVVRDERVGAQLDETQREAFEGYFVVRAADTLERFLRVVAPATGPVDHATLENALGQGPHRVNPDTAAIDAPVLVASGRHDAWVGWQRQQRLGDQYPHATVVTVDGAGHALPHERPALVAALLTDWLDRAGTPRDSVAGT